MEFFAWIEQTGISLWVRESIWGFPITLTFHSIAMGFLVGSNFVLDFRILGLAKQVPLTLLQRLFPIMWLSFLVILVSGLMLLAAYPAKALTNLVFYLKFLFIFLAFLITRKLSQELIKSSTHNNEIILGKYKILAASSIVLWIGVITTGRFLAYTYSILLSSQLY